MKNRPNILVFGEIGLVRCFGEAGLSVLLATSPHSRLPATFSRYCKDKIFLPPNSSDGFVEALLDFGSKQNGVTYIASDNDPLVLTLSKNRDLLSHSFAFILPEHEIIQAIIDKTLFGSLANRHSLPVPRTFAIGSLKDLDENIHEIPFPCIVKPAQQQDWWKSEALMALGGRKKALTFSNTNDLVESYSRMCSFSPDVVIQEYVHGRDECLYDLHALLDHSSNAVSFVLGRKIRTYPPHFGMGCYTETLQDDEITNTGLEALKKINFRGLANINMKRDSRTGDIKILEINPRSSLWSYLDAFAGNNLAVKAYYLATGQPFSPTCEYDLGVRWLNFKNDFHSLLEYRKAGEWHFRSWLRSFGGKTAFHVFSLRDPLPFIASIVQFVIRKITELPKRLSGRLQK